MATIASLLVSLKADFGDTKGKVDELHDHFDSTGHAAEEAGEHLDNMAKHAHDTGASFESLQESAMDFGKELMHIVPELLEIAGTMEVLKESLEIYAEIQSVTVALTQFTGSVEAAGEMIEQLESTSESEALKFPEVLPAAQHFMALGFSADQTARSIQVAGNTAWALGTSVESVTQRMGMMAMGGQVSGRYLRSLGISLEDLGRSMGITGKDTADLEDKVRRAFKFETEEERLAALQGAMDKSAGLGSKEAEMLSGKWIEMKNAMHEAFAVIGEDLSGVASVVLSAVTGMIKALTGLINMLDIVKDVKMSVDVQGTVGGSGRGGRGGSGRGGGGNAASLEKTGAPQTQEDLDRAAAGAKALKESDASQEYARRKTEIDSAAAHHKALIELARNYYKSQAEAKFLSAQQLIAWDKAFNREELDVELAAIAQKKALQTSSKGLKEEEKDQSLDAQAQTARNTYMTKNAALDNKETARQAHVIDEGIKLGEEKAKKDESLHERQLKELAAFGEEMERIQKEMNTERAKTGLEDATDAAKSGAVTARASESGTERTLKSQELAQQRQYGLEYTHTLAQQVEYQRTLGELRAHELDAKAAEAAAAAKSSMDIAHAAQSASDAIAASDTTEMEKKTAATKAQDALNKALGDALKVTEAQAAADDARFETNTKILELIKQQSVLGQLEAQFDAAGQNVPAQLGASIAAGITHQGKGGMDIGKQVAEAMRNVGKQLFGDVLTATMKQMIESLGLNTLAQNIMHVLFGANTTATVANTAATAANTVASGGLLGKLLGHIGIHPKTQAPSPAPTPTSAAPAGVGAAADPNLRYQLELNIERDMVMLDADLQQLNNTDLTLNNSVQQLIQAIDQLIAALRNGVQNSGSKSSSGLLGVLGAVVGAAAGAIAGASASGGGGVSNGGGGGGGMIPVTSTITAPGNEAGGFESAGVTHLIGERGPELFTPESSGTVIPNSQLAGNHTVGNVNFHIHESGNPRDTAREVSDTLRQLSPAFAAQSVPYSS